VSEAPAALVLGWLADRAAGDPLRGHPVAGFGRLAGDLEGRMWRPSRLAGACYAGVLVGAAGTVTALAWRLTNR
jgi:adenosylcobinamide-phosphate synthase